MTSTNDFGNGVTGTLKWQFVNQDADRWSLVAKELTTEARRARRQLFGGNVDD